MKASTPFYTGGGDQPLTLYRGEIEHAVTSTPRRKGLRALYFGDVEVANHYSGYYAQDYIDKTGRIYPAHLVLRKPFITQLQDPFLEMRDVTNRLGRVEALRIALRFSKYIEETDNWQTDINKSGNYDNVEQYLRDIRSDVCRLYFQAHRFFDSHMEVSKLRRLGYDGAIHGGSGIGSAGKTEYCVFSFEQVYSTVSKSFLDKGSF